MACRTFTTAPRKAADGRIIVDSIEQAENEDYHDYTIKLNHNMDDAQSETRPGWRDVTCPCGMRITISPAVDAYLDELDELEIAAED